MRFMSFEVDGKHGLAVQQGSAWHGASVGSAHYCGTLETLLAAGGSALHDAAKKLRAAAEIDVAKIKILPPLSDPEKIVCVGLNYVDHSAESGFKQPDFPTIFSRFNSSLIGHGA
ncbi:MAG: fumarylacetoacetate hydrolase, partial [Alphaproteobacteria bacterium]|nr:fumarylacetoacetate hydrolase [Alphaproteobacteria bacterium]